MTVAHRGHARLLHAAGLCRKAGNAVREDYLKAEWESVTAFKADAERPVTAAARRVYRRMAAVAVERLQAYQKATPEEQAAEVVAAQAIDLSAWAATLGEEMGPVVLAAIREGYRVGALRIGEDLAFDAERIGVRRASEQILQTFESVPETARSRVATAVRDALQSGADRDGVVRAVREAFGELEAKQAELVGRTAGTSAFEAGQMESFDRAGVRRRWLSQRDGSTRASHDAADGQEVGAGEAFDVGGVAMMHPGDPAAPIGETASCRCTVLPILAAAEPDPLDVRDEAIRAAYPAAKRQAKAEGLTAEVARERIGAPLGLSERQVRRIIQEGARG